MAGLSTVSSSEGEGGSGEVSLRGGSDGIRNLSIFVLEPESVPQLCLGAMNGGVKFCLVPCEKCTVAAHTKKIEVFPAHVYVNSCRNTAFTDPHVAATILGPSLNAFLSELRPREE